MMFDGNKCLFGCYRTLKINEKQASHQEQKKNPKVNLCGMHCISPAWQGRGILQCKRGDKTRCRCKYMQCLRGFTSHIPR